MEVIEYIDIELMDLFSGVGMCGVIKGFYIILMILILWLVVIFLFLVVVFYYGVWIWYNLYIYFSEERIICYKIFVCFIFIIIFFLIVGLSFVGIVIFAVFV